MKTLTSIALSLSVAGLLAVAPLAGAQSVLPPDLPPDLVPQSSQPALPAPAIPGDSAAYTETFTVPVEESNGVRYVNGGASSEQVDYLKAHAREFPLQIVFSGRGGEYGVADTVTVKNSNGEVLSVADAGPILMMQVPPGRYTVEAHFGDGVERKVVSVGSGVTKLNWNTPKASN